MARAGWLGRFELGPGDLLALAISLACLLACAAWTWGTTWWSCGAGFDPSLGSAGRLGRATLWETVYIFALTLALWRLAVLLGPEAFQRRLLWIVLVAGGLGAAARVYALPSWLGYAGPGATPGGLGRVLLVGLVGQGPCLVALLVIFTMGGELPVLGSGPAPAPTANQAP